MPFLIRVWQPDAFAPSQAQPFGQEIVLDRELLGPEEMTISSTANAPRLEPLADTAAFLNVPQTGKPVVVIEGVDFASLQANIPSGQEPWRVGPGQLGKQSRLARAEGACLALVRQLDGERPGPVHHLMLLPRARVIQPGARELVRANALVIVGKGAVDLRADTTKSTEDIDGSEVRVWSVELPKDHYHTGLAPLLDAFPSHEPDGKLTVPLHDGEMEVRELAVALGAMLERGHLESAFYPVLESGNRPRLALAYVRADKTTGVRLSDTEFHGWLTELRAVFRSRTVPVAAARAAVPSRSAPLASFQGIETRSPVFAKILERAQIFGPGDANLLLLGPTGTGKEHLAKAIHASSARADKPFVALNCAGLSKELIQSELFGHVKGSFTGATTRKGLFLEADGGTLLLDEIADASLDFQPVLLRALQERRIRPVGSDKEVPVDVRVLAATSQPLAELMEKKLFRADLYHRLAGAELILPALKERREDIPALTRDLLRSLGSGAEPTEKALDALQSYNWPGNVRELETVLRAALERAKARERALGATVAPSVLDVADIDLAYGKAWPKVSQDELFYYYGPEIKRLAREIWQEQELPAAGDEKHYYRRAKQRAALLFLDSERPREEWPPALKTCWNRLFRAKWATSENGRGLGYLLQELCVDTDNEAVAKKAGAWVISRVGAPDPGFDPKKTRR